MINQHTSLAEAMRVRARFITAHLGNRECNWGDGQSVVSALYEMADVIDSWSGEYLSKELTYEENERRRYSTTHWTQTPPKPMTMEERIAAVKKAPQIDF